MPAVMQCKGRGSAEMLDYVHFLHGSLQTKNSYTSTILYLIGLGECRV